MKVLSPHRYDLRGGLVLQKGETVLGRVSPIAQHYLDKLIASGDVKVVDEPKPTTRSTAPAATASLPSTPAPATAATAPPATSEPLGPDVKPKRPRKPDDAQ